MSGPNSSVASALAVGRSAQIGLFMNQASKLLSRLLLISLATGALVTGSPVAEAVAASPDDCVTWETLRSDLTERIGSSQDSTVSARHRGDFTAELPENSLGAFRESYRQCRAAFETDVRPTVDGHLVAFHDVKVGKMLEPTFDPWSGKGPNAALSELTLAQLQSKRLVNTATRTATRFQVPSVEELLEDYVAANGQSLIYLEVKDGPSIVPTAQVLVDIAALHPDARLTERVILKINMAEFPTPTAFAEALSGAGIRETIMANPVMTPNAADRINALPYSIPNVDGQSYSSNATRAVAQWAHASGGVSPTVEVVVKDSTDFIETTEHTDSPQGGFAYPTTLEPANTRAGSMAEMATVVKHNKKALGVFVPVPDFVMWRTDLIRDIGVPNTAADKTPSVPVTEAYYNNDSLCCYRLQDRLKTVDTSHETSDLRMNLAWQRSIGANVMTADDTDSIDTYFDDSGWLAPSSTPKPKRPDSAMNSKLSWELGYVDQPDSPLVKLKGWQGASAGLWGGQVCLWSNAAGESTWYGWIYECGSKRGYDAGYADGVRTSVETDGRLRIFDAKGNCLGTTWLNGRPEGTISWNVPPSCASENTLWSWGRDHRLTDTYGQKLTFSNEGALYYGTPYSPTRVVPSDAAVDSWSQWAIEP